MSCRNYAKRQTTLTWTSEDEPYNDAAMRVFVDLFQAQHDEPTERARKDANEIVAMHGEHLADLDALMHELVRRRIAWRLELHR